MRKLLLLVLFLGTEIGCFSEVSQPNIKEWQKESLGYFGNGSAMLLCNDPQRALEDFHKAYTPIDQSDKSSCMFIFLVSFGQAIAYDNLGFRKQCEQAIASLFFSMSMYEDQENSKEMGCQTETLDDSQIAIRFFEQMSSLAISPDVKQLLSSIVEEMSEAILPPFKFADPSLLGAMGWYFDDDNNSSVQNCKSFWKRMKNFFKELGELIQYIADGFRAVNDVKEEYERWKDSNKRK